MPELFPFLIHPLPQIPLPQPHCSGPHRMSDHTVMSCKYFYYRTNHFLVMLLVFIFALSNWAAPGRECILLSLSPPSGTGPGTLEVLSQYLITADK